jgi:hypothetical protein
MTRGNGTAATGCVRIRLIINICHIIERSFEASVAAMLDDARGWRLAWRLAGCGAG